MAAKLIQLNEYKSTIRSKRNGVAFPTIYRARGYCFGERDGQQGDLGPVFYTLSKNDDGGYLNVTYEPIRGFSEEDSGWLFLRHHPNRDNVEGYLDALTDLHQDTFEDGGQKIFQTKEGLFSLVHRPAMAGRPDRLVVYVTRAPDPHVNHPIAGQFSNGWMDHHQIIHLDGSLTEDPDILLPPEADED
jgi:hypothetical protein